MACSRSQSLQCFQKVATGPYTQGRHLRTTHLASITAPGTAAAHSCPSPSPHMSAHTAANVRWSLPAFTSCTPHNTGQMKGRVHADAVDENQGHSDWRVGMMLEGTS